MHSKYLLNIIQKFVQCLDISKKEKQKCAECKRKFTFYVNNKYSVYTVLQLNTKLQSFNNVVVEYKHMYSVKTTLKI